MYEVRKYGLDTQTITKNFQLIWRNHANVELGQTKNCPISISPSDFVIGSIALFVDIIGSKTCVKSKIIDYKTK